LMKSIPQDNLYAVIAGAILLSSANLSIDSFVSGFVAGSPKMGLINGILFYLLLILLVSLSIETVQLLIILVVFAPFALIVCAAAGYYGGLTCDRKKLYR